MPDGTCSLLGFSEVGLDAPFVDMVEVRGDAVPLSWGGWDVRGKQSPEASTLREFPRLECRRHLRLKPEHVLNQIALFAR